MFIVINDFFMKFHATNYHFDLLKDNERISSFFEAINDYDAKKDLAYDLGCGSGILSYFLSSKFNNVISLECDCEACKCASINLSNFSNVKIINSNVLDYNFDRKADLIVCEMMDTALIDEEQIPVLNHTKRFLKKTGKIIPQGIINIAELVKMEREYIHWDENSKYCVLSNEVIYSQFNFLDEINPIFESDISFKIKKDGLINGIKITTITKLTENIVCGPTPMLNPPLLIPLKNIQVKENDLIKVNLKYNMGEGIESIKTKFI